MTARLATLLALLCLAPAAWPEETLGRLFFTPERRAALDLQRQQNQVQNRDTLSESNITLNGVVRRSGGRNTTWFNGNPVDDQVATKTGDTASATAKPGSAPLRVGDTLNQGSGEREDLLKGGSLSIRRPANRPKP